MLLLAAHCGEELAYCLNTTVQLCYREEVLVGVKKA